MAAWGASWCRLEKYTQQSAGRGGVLKDGAPKGGKVNIETHQTGIHTEVVEQEVGMMEMRKGELDWEGGATTTGVGKQGEVRPQTRVLPEETAGFHHCLFLSRPRASERSNARERDSGGE